MEEESTSTKSCPYCGEEILSVAVKCKHCGSILNNNSNDSSPSKTAKSNAGAIGGLIGASGSLYYWFLSNALITNFISISPFDQILKQADNPEIMINILWAAVAITTIGAALILGAIFRASSKSHAPQSSVQ